MVGIEGANVQAILAFQTIVKKTGVIDGRVDINGTTYKLLVKNARRKRPANVKNFNKLPRSKLTGYFDELLEIKDFTAMLFKHCEQRGL